MQLARGSSGRAPSFHLALPCVCTPRAASCPPALEALVAEQGTRVAIVGAAKNGDCVPKRSNYSAFAAAVARGGAAQRGAGGDGGGGLLAVVRESGHLQFLNTMTTLQR